MRDPGQAVSPRYHVDMPVVMLKKKRRRIFAGEERWFGLLDDVGPSALRLGFIDAGVTPQIAGNLVWFLEDQATIGQSDLGRTQDGATRTRYRRILRELDLADVNRRSTRRVVELRAG